MDQIKKMIRKKLEERGYYDVEDTKKPQENRPTYDLAKAAGDTHTMLNYKLGIYDAEDREQELNQLLKDIDIKAITKELTEIGDRIGNRSLEIERQLEQDKERCKHEYEEKMEAHYRKGGIRGGMSSLVIRGDFEKALESIEVKAERSKAEIKRLLYRKGILEQAKTKYMEDNAELITELQKAKRIKEIQDSGLLGDID